MNRNSILAVLFFLAACGAVFAWYGSHPGDTPSLDTPIGEDVADTHETDESDGGGEDVSIETEQPPEDDRIFGGIEEAQTQDAGQAGAGDGPRVKVVVGDDKRAVRGATVAILPSDEYATHYAKHEGSDKRFTTIIEAYGKRFVTGSDGTVPLVIPPPPESSDGAPNNKISGRRWIGIAAWDDEHFGVQWLSTSKVGNKGGGSTIEVKIDPDETLDVLAVGIDQRPIANFPIGFWDLGTKKNANRREVHRTGADGHLVLRHFQTMKASGRWALLPDMIGKSLPHVILEKGALESSYTMRVPPFGSMRFDLRGRDGRVLGERGTVTLVPLELPKVEIEGKEFRMSNRTEKTEGGSVTFDFVGLGIRCKTYVAIGRHFRDRPSTEYAGPLTSGQEQRYELRLENDGVAITGHAELADFPLPADGKLELFFTADANVRTGETSDLGENGSFSFFLPFIRASSYRLLFRLRIDKTVYETFKSVSVSAPGARIDVGALRLEPVISIVSGRVIDQFGKPVRGAQVSLQESIRDTAGRERSINIGVNTVRSEKDGAFALMGRPIPGQFTLRVTASGYENKTVSVRMGGGPIEVRLDQLGELHASVQLDPGIVKRVRLRARHSSGRSTSSRTSPSKAGLAAFRLRNIQPGTYTVTVEIDEWGHAIWLRQGFVVRAGSQSIGQTIDLRGMLQRFELRGVLDNREFKKGDRANVLVNCPIPGDPNTYRQYRLEKPLVLIAPRADIRYRAHREGCKLIEGIALPGITELRFTTNSPHRFHVPGISQRVEGIQNEIAEVSRAGASMVFQKVAKANATGSISLPKNGTSANFDRGSQRRSIPIVNDRVSVSFEYDDADYDVFLEVALRHKTIHRFGDNVRINVLNNFADSQSFGRVFMGYGQETIRIPLGRYAVNSEEVRRQTDETTYPIPPTFESEVAKVRTKLEEQARKNGATNAAFPGVRRR
ncbi:MAG: carboxypeptidase regulatory-like domain-containing protein [Planctomycetes bacterium]|nr:carboxypeptidase regulatory-like domain-containing protein [Planctomycetota bacterium]